MNKTADGSMMSLLNPFGRLITNRPQFYIALTSMVIGTQLFLAGFLGEIMIRSKKEEKTISLISL